MAGSNYGEIHEANMRRCKEFHEIARRNRFRLCMVGKEQAIFHRWTEERQLVDASPMIGGHPGGEIASTLAIVEYMDGRVERVLPEQIRFLDTKDNMPMKKKDSNK